MGIFVDLEEEDLRVLLAAYENQRKSLQEQLRSIAEDIKKLDDKIDRVKKTGAKPPLVATQITQQDLAGINTYNRDGTWNEKIKFVFGEEKRPLTTAEIVTGILSHEPELERKKVTTSVSATLTVAADKGLYNKQERAGQDLLYSLK